MQKFSLVLDIKLRILIRLASASFLGFVVALSFPPFGWWLLAFAGYTLFFLLIFTAKTAKEAVGIGFLQSFVFFLFHHRWFFSFLPFDWLGIENSISSFLILLPLIVLPALIASGGYGLMAWASWSFKKRVKWWQISLAIASIWAIGEYSLALLSSILFWSPELPRLVPWTTFSLGNLLVSQPNLAALASIGGIWLITFLLILISSLSALVIFTFICSSGQWQNKVSAFLPKFLIIILLFIVWWEMGNQIVTDWRSQIAKADTINIALIQTESSEENLQGRLESLLKLAIAEKPNLIVIGEVLHGPWPEILPEEKNLPPIIGERVEVTADDFQKNSLLAFRPRPKQIECQTRPGGTSFCILRSEPEIITIKEKQVLMPFGEYLPALSKVSLKVLNRDIFLSRFEKTRQIKTKKDLPFELTIDNVNIGALSCGVFLTAMVRPLLLAEAEIIVTPASWQRYHNKKAALRQMMAFVQLRAIELGKPIGQATHGGESFVVYPEGTILRSGLSGDYVFNVGVPKFQKATFYHRFGDWLPKFAILVFLVMASLKLFQKTLTKTKSIFT